MPNTLSTRTKRAASSSEIPYTSEDMTALYSWRHGQTLKGTHALENIGMKNYINDINLAWGKESDYYNGNVIYVDTFKSVPEQLLELKN